MGKVNIIKKSRKEYTCDRCKQLIPVGSTYYRGDVYFGRTIIRCNKCKLEGWEVTSSDYQLSVGAIVNRWREDYEIGETTHEEIMDALQEIRDDLEDRLSNMPEQLQYSESGELLQDRIDCIDGAISDLCVIDVDDMKLECADDYACENSQDIHIEDDDISWEHVIGVFGEDAEKSLEERLNERIADCIDEALEQIEV